MELDSEVIVTGSAYTHARENFNYYPYETAFKKVRDLIDRSYREEYKLKTRFGLQVIAVDGSEIALPNKKDLLEEFGAVGRGAKSTTARMSLLYDVLNDLIYEATLDPIAIGEREQALKLIQQLSEHQDLSKMVFIFDRGYFTTDLIDLLEEHNSYYIFGMRKKLRSNID